MPRPSRSRSAPVPSSDRIACCASSGRAAPRRCGWPSASTAPSSARWRSSCRTSGWSIAASSNASRASARSCAASSIRTSRASTTPASTNAAGPYLALEYVDGVPPDEYCRAERLDLRDKLALFLNILRAVAFAHARLIVHRDLKPNNILIAEGSDVRLLDFGIARLLQPRRAPSRRSSTRWWAPPRSRRRMRRRSSSPASPSRSPPTCTRSASSCSRCSRAAVRTRPPGHSLGAYEHEVLHVEPPLTSRVAPPAEAGALRGDLDAIVAKALEKPPGDRYASVEAFAADIERHLAARAHRGAAALVRLRRAQIRCGAMRCRWRPRSGCSRCLSIALGIAAWQWRDAERQRAMAVERLANSDAAAHIHCRPCSSRACSPANR